MPFRRVVACMIHGVLVLFLGAVAHADRIVQMNGTVECRVLENSGEVVVFETVSGEYVVLKQSQVVDITDEPVEQFFFYRGRYHEQRGEMQQAMFNYYEAVNRNPNHEAARQRLTTLQEEENQARWNEGISRAQHLKQNREYRLALNAFQDVLQMRPDDSVARRVVRAMSDTHAELAYRFFNHCYDEDAILEITRAEELNPNSAEIYFVLGRIHHHNRNFGQARLEYERALELDPAHQSARVQLTRLVEDMRRPYMQ